MSATAALISLDVRNYRPDSHCHQVVNANLPWFSQGDVTINPSGSKLSFVHAAGNIRRERKKEKNKKHCMDKLERKGRKSLKEKYLTVCSYFCARVHRSFHETLSLCINSTEMGLRQLEIMRRLFPFAIRLFLVTSNYFWVADMAPLILSCQFLGEMLFLQL